MRTPPPSPSLAMLLEMVTIPDPPRIVTDGDIPTKRPPPPRPALFPVISTFSLTVSDVPVTAIPPPLSPAVFSWTFVESEILTLPVFGPVA